MNSNHLFRDFSRRELLKRSGLGVGWMAASTVLQESLHANPSTLNQHNPHTLAARRPHFPARAKAVIHIFANGGPSHIDTFDPKPKLEEYAGREIPGSLKTERRTGAALPSPFQFQQHGESGLPVSELFPSVARHADRLLVVR